MYMQHIMAHSGGMQKWAIQIPSIPILVSVLFPSLVWTCFELSFLFNYAEKKFACPCGKCSLRQFLDGNCPEKGSEFPCLNISMLSEGEQRLLKQKLIDESEKIKISFAKLEMSTKRFLKSKASCSPEELKDNILKMSILKDASDFDSIFHILINNNVWSWYSFGYLKRIICLCSNDDSELFHQLNEYNNEFEEFCKRSVFECPHLISNFKPEYHDCLFVKLADEDDDFKNPSLKNLKNKFETKLSMIIKVEPLHLVLLTYQDGCTQLLYSLPRAVAKKAFPLSQEQKEMLMKMVLECYLFSVHEVRSITDCSCSYLKFLCYSLN